MQGPGRTASAHRPTHPPELLAVAAHGLAGSRRRLPQGPLDFARWSGLVDGCRREDIVGLLSYAVRGGALAVDDAQRDELSALADEGLSRSHSVQGAAVAASRRLQADGVDHRVLDGPVMAWRAYPEPQARHTNRAEILVDPIASSRVAALEAGHEPAVHMQVELFPSGHGPRVGITELSASAAQVAVADHPVPALSAEAQLIWTCVQATRGTLLQFRDVAQLALADGLSTSTTTELARRWSAGAVVAEVLRSVWQGFDLADRTALSAWAFRYEMSSGERRALRSYTTDGTVRRRFKMPQLARALFPPLRRSSP